MFDPFGDRLGRDPESEANPEPESELQTGSEPPAAAEPAQPTEPTPAVPPPNDPFAPPRYEPAPQPASPYDSGAYRPPGDPAPAPAPGSTWSASTPADDTASYAPVPPVAPPPAPRPSDGTGGSSSHFWTPVLAVLVVLSVVLSSIAVARSSGHTTKIIQAGTDATTATVSTSPTVSGSGKSSEEPVAAVAQTLASSVVQIETSQGLGSGFIYDTDGHVLTAAHVVEGAGNTVTVRLADGTKQTGRVVGSDENTDVAVVKIDLGGTKAKAASLALSSPLQVGQTAVAIGSPFGLEQTVTAGIVSAVDRAMQTPTGAIDMVQTDAPINPGNSGGPLADLSGRVIGINDQIESESGSSSGVGFAIPIGTAKAVADKIVSGQPVTFAFLGVQSQDSGQGIVGNGALIVSVENGSPAGKAGIQQGDIITKIGSTPISDATSLTAIIRQAQPGATVQVTYQRNGHAHTASVTLGSTSGT
ncbi:MAG TPA: trypsin-like peptidase domain-containing protein [Acidimicrobiia bacterium]|jgi:putative serine protease PepD|nr:trypsin-like peptidase domain-containing protein [Acidimicrobiia bacterium]